MVIEKNTDDLNTDVLDTYQDGWEHINDELRLLDMRIRLHWQLQSSLIAEGQLQQFKGLVISEQEVENLLDYRLPDKQSKQVLSGLRDAIHKMELNLQSRIKRSLESGVFLFLEHLAWSFDLNAFERNCLLLCLAIECERKYEKLFAYLQDDLTCKYPTIDLAIKLFCESKEDRIAARMAFSMEAPLSKYLLENNEENTERNTRLSYPLKLNSRLLEYFYQPLQIDPLLQAYTDFFHPYQPIGALLLDHEIQERLQAWWERALSEQNGRKLLVLLSGPTGSGKFFQVQHLCCHFQFLLFSVDLSQMPDDKHAFAKSLKNIIRECLLKNAVPCFRKVNIIRPGDADKEAVSAKTNGTGRWRMFLQALEEMPGPVFVLSSTPLEQTDFARIFAVLKSDFNIPNELGRKNLWEFFGKSYTFAEKIDWGQMASKFRFTPGQIKNALLQAYESACGHWDSRGRISIDDLHTACFAQGRHYLGKTALKINPVYSWKDLILPADTVELLMNACKHMKFRHVVFGQWGFAKRLAYGRGLSILFSGLPGTGKTMAAQVIANELQLELYRIDLAQVVSKYIGETEKNLRQIFQEAESSNAILFFDEADALFGKRSEVKDSHDRYANIEISYLLQKVEEYDGVSILATNLMKNIDEAFVRRISFIIEFPFPDAESRKRIWRSMFPGEAPVHKDLDFDFLARRFEIAGGNIKNIVVAAAYLAAQNNDAIRMQHILKATKYEYQKIGRVLLREDLGEYYEEL
jgi:hypothetical protein